MNQLNWIIIVAKERQHKFFTTTSPSAYIITAIKDGACYSSIVSYNHNSA